MRTCDVLIIGGGIAGASAAFELALDAGAAARARRPTRLPHHRPLGGDAYTETYGNAHHPRPHCWQAALLCGAAGRFLGLSAAYPARRLSRSRRRIRPSLLAQDDRDAALAPVARSSRRRAEAIARVPVLRRDYLAGALSTRFDGHRRQRAMHQGYLKGLRARGGRLVTDAEVEALDHRGGAWRSRPAQRRFDAPRDRRRRRCLGRPGRRPGRVAPLGLVPKRRTAFPFDAARLDLARLAAGPSTSPSISISSRRPGACSPRRPTRPPSPPIDASPRISTSRSPSTGIEHRDAPRSAAAIAHRWAGLRTFAADRRRWPASTPGAPGFFWLAGQGGYGIQTAPALACAAASLLVDGVLPADLLRQGMAAEDLLPLRFRLRPAPKNAELREF